MEECPQKRRHDAGRLKHFSYLCITGKSCFSYETRDPVASLAGIPRRVGGGTNGRQQARTNRFLHRWTEWTWWTDKEALMLDIKGGKEGFMG